MNLKDFANKLGLSETTISHALNGKRYVKPATVSLILEKMKEYNYVPNINARRLANKRNYMAIMITNKTYPHRDPFLNELYASLSFYLRQHHYDLLINHIDQVHTDNSNLLHRLQNKEVDGCIIIGRISLYEQIKDMKIPCVLIDNIPNEPGPKLGTIFNNCDYGLRQVFEYLVTHKFSRIGFLARHANDDPEYDFILKMVAENNLIIKPEWIDFSLEDLEDSCKAALKMLSLPDKPEIIITRTDLQALGVQHAASLLRMDVPKDIAIIGGSDTLFSQLGLPKISSVGVCCDALGEMAANLLMENINKSPESPQMQEIFAEFHLRGSI